MGGIMNNESGRSLIEILGVLAIIGIMTAGTIVTYNSIRKNQIRMSATTKIEQIAKDVKILLQTRGDYTGVSIDYLIKAGALKSGDSPIGGEAWSVASSVNGDYFSINITDISESDCIYFATKPFEWVQTILINGYEVSDVNNCFSSDTNQISFIIE